MDKANAAAGSSRAPKKPAKPKIVKEKDTASGQKSVTTQKAKAAKLEPKKTTTVLDLVCEAIEAVGDGKKGASVYAIKKYIISKTNIETSRHNKLINVTLVKGFEKGILARPTFSKNSNGATGSFTLAIKGAKPKVKKADAENHEIEAYVSDSEIEKKPSKPRKRVLSDSNTPGSYKVTPSSRHSIRRASGGVRPKNKNKAAASETFTIENKEAKKTKAGKPKIEKPSQDKAPKTVRVKKLFNGS